MFFKKRAIRIFALSFFMIFLISVVSAAQCDYVDIGVSSSESGHDMISWGPIEPATHGGNWGDIADEDGTCRVVWDSSDNDPEAKITLNPCGVQLTSQTLRLRTLDGLANDSFEMEVKIKNTANGKEYNYDWSGDTNEFWVTHEIALPNYLNTGDPIEVTIEAAGPKWAGFDTYGQTAVQWIELENENIDEENPTCTIDYLENVDSHNQYYFTSPIIISEDGEFYVYGDSSDDFSGIFNVQYNRTSPDTYLLWTDADPVDGGFSELEEEWRSDPNDDEFIDGLHEICCKVEDNAHNTAIGECEEFCIDQSEPEQVQNVQHSNPSECVSNYVNQAPEFSWNEAIDEPECSEIDYYEIKLYYSNGNLINTYEEEGTSFTVPNPENGEDYYIKVRAVDLAENQGEWSEPSEHVYYDNEDPSVEITSPPEDKWIDPGFYVSETDTDNLGLYKCYYRIWNNGSFTLDWTETPCNEDVYIDVDTYCPVDGLNNCRVYKKAVDNACNTNGEMTHKQFDIDTTPPEVSKSISCPKYPGFEWMGYLIDWFVKDTTEITLTCDDGEGSGVQAIYYRINEGSWIEYESPFTLGDDGVYYVEYYCIDNVNKTSEIESETDKVDTLAPETIKTYEGSEFWGYRLIQGVNAFIRYISGQTQIILTASDSEVGVDKTWWTLFIPNEEGEDVEAYIDGKWYESYDDEFNDCLEENECYGVAHYGLDESDFSKDEFEVDLEVEKDDGKIKWDVELGGIDGHWHTGVQVVIASGTEPLFLLGWSSENTEEPIYKEYDGGWSSPMPLPEGMSVSGSYNEEEYTIEIDEYKLDCPWYWAINVEASWPGHSSAEQQNYPADWGRWTAVNTAEGVACLNYEECIEQCNITFWQQKTEYMGDFCNTQLEEGWWCLYEEPINIYQSCDHKICYYSEDYLNNIEDVKCQVFSADVNSPSIQILNPTQEEADSIEKCVQSIVAVVEDDKSGIKRVWAELWDDVGMTPLREENMSLTIYGTYEALMDKQLSAGNYTLKVCAKDNVDNVYCEEIKETLTPGIFIEYIEDPICLIDPETGGECDFTFHMCARDADSIKMWMDKLGEVVTPGMMNAEISNEGDSGYVGLNDEGIEAGTLCLGDLINRRTSFDLSLDIPSDVASMIGTGSHALDYYIESYKNTEECQED
jgi:hypothetical protein